MGPTENQEPQGIRVPQVSLDRRVLLDDREQGETVDLGVLPVVQEKEGSPDRSDQRVSVLRDPRVDKDLGVPLENKDLRDRPDPEVVEDRKVTEDREQGVLPEPLDHPVNQGKEGLLEIVETTDRQDLGVKVEKKGEVLPVYQDTLGLPDLLGRVDLLVLVV